MVSGNKNNARKSICPLQKKRKKNTHAITIGSKHAKLQKLHCLVLLRQFACKY